MTQAKPRAASPITDAPASPADYDQPLERCDVHSAKINTHSNGGPATGTAGTTQDGRTF
jgi:hypothetical protein